MRGASLTVSRTPEAFGLVSNLKGCPPKYFAIFLFSGSRVGLKAACAAVQNLNVRNQAIVLSSQTNTFCESNLKRVQSLTCEVIVKQGFILSIAFNQR
jgi:hypothetical protein